MVKAAYVRKKVTCIHDMELISSFHKHLWYFCVYLYDCMLQIYGLVVMEYVQLI